MAVKGKTNKNNQQKEQEMKNMNQEKKSVLGLMALLACTFLATSANAGDQSHKIAGDRLVGFFDSQVTLTNCNGVVIRTFESYQLFNQGGTLTSTDNQPGSSPHSRHRNLAVPRRGKLLGALSDLHLQHRRHPWSGHAKVNRDLLQLAADGNSYTSAGSVEFFDTNGNLVATLCASEVATRVVN